MKIKKILILLGLIIATTLFLARFQIPATKEFKVNTFVNETDELTKQILKRVGSPPTFDGVNQAQIYLDQRKNDLANRSADIKSSKNFTKNSNASIELQNCRTRNRNLIADIYNRFAKKSSVDNDALNEFKKQKKNTTSYKVRRELDVEIEKQSQILRNNILLLEQIDVLIADFEAIFDNKNMEETL